MSDNQEHNLDEAHLSHSRQFQGNQLVYPVLSRRSRGLSIGINLNPDTHCNFNCLYCQVEREARVPPAFSLERLDVELRRTLDLVLTEDIYNYLYFRDIPENLRRLNDIALSGDGEPTASAQFLPVCRQVATIKDELGLDEVKIILITNSSLLHKAGVKEGLGVLDAHQGEIWAKLDAGTEAYYQQVNQSLVPFARILENVLETAKKRPIVIQTLFCRMAGQRPTAEEITAYAQNISDMIEQGGRFKAIQLHTIARKPRSSEVSALSNDELDQIAREITAVVSVPVETFYGK